MLKDGKWQSDWQPVQNSDEKGGFVRQVSSFRDWVTVDGAPGPEGQAAYPAQKGRYHLYVGYICPWACRTLMMRKLKKLEDVISVSVVEPMLTDQGWRFGDYPGSTGAEPHIGATYMHELYSHSDPMVNGRATIPVLWDKERGKIINNESADIIRILDSAFDGLSTADFTARPEALLDEIEALNEALYEPFNNGVYKAGFATTQAAYEEAVTQVFKTLDDMEQRLSDGRSFLLGDELTEPDIRFFVTLIRFDAAYVTAFKCNLRRVADYPHLQAYLKRLYQRADIRSTVNIDHIKAGYYSIKAINPVGLVPVGPDLSALEAE